MSDIIYVPHYAYSIEEVDFTDLSMFDKQWDWDGKSKIKITQYNAIGSNSFWLESLKDWDYEKNPRWLNEKASITLKWLEINHPELLI